MSNGTSMFNCLESITPLSESFKVALNKALVPEWFKPHQLIAISGTAENRIRFIEEGYARTLIYDEAGFEHTLKFWMPGDFIFSYAAYWKEPSPEYLEFITDSRTFSISYTDLKGLRSDYPETETLIIEITQVFHRSELEKESFYVMSSEDRYKYFIKKYPEVIRYVAIKYIASFLRMSRENFSRLNSKANKKK